MIDVFGSSVLKTFDSESLRSIPCLNYMGGFDDFFSLRPWQYDAFLYTSAYDGMPNVILEAMSAGLLVIAPEIGGIPELVTPDRGFLIPDSSDDDQLAHAYVESIRRLYEGQVDLAAMSKAAIRLIAQRHSRDAFNRRVAEVLGPRDGQGGLRSDHETTA
jgi:glycosyltransferase involved in cell wall biosynthesis